MVWEELYGLGAQRTRFAVCGCSKRDILPYCHMSGKRGSLIRAKIDEELEQKFRRLAMRRFGYSKGALTKAAEQAILEWVSAEEKDKVVFEGDPVEALDGLLAGVEIDSVRLQHEIKDLWVQGLAKNLSR
jgi:hypothetical protein